MARNQKLIVEIIDARNLLPKDGHGTSSPYVVINFHGQRKRSQTVIRDLNPSWNELLEFNVAVGVQSDVFGDVLEVDVYHDKLCGPTRRNNFLGRLRLSSGQFVKKGEEALIYYPLEKKSLLSWIQGDIGLKIYYADEVEPPPAPPLEVKPDVAEPPADAKSDVPAPPLEVKPDVAEPPADAKSDAPAPVPSVEIKAPESDKQPKTEAEAETKANKPDAEVVAPPESKSDSAPPATDPSSDGGKPSEVPPEPELPPSDNAAAPEPDTLQQDPPPTPRPMQPSDESQWVPSPELMESTILRPMPEVRFSGITAPQPIPPPRPSTAGRFTSEPPETIPIERSSYDLVQKMHYLFVRIVKARSLPTNRNPFVKIGVSNYQVCSKPARKTTFFEWEQTFAFGRDSPDSSSILEVSVWDPPTSKSADVAGRNFLGGICFDVTEIPLRDPPDSPLATQWYRLEGGGAHNGDLMLATWMGTQADESFPDAWKTDTAGSVGSKAKIYLSPKLWYLRASVIEAQDIMSLASVTKECSFQIKAQLGFQILKTKISVTRNGSGNLLWNEDLIFVAAEPFSDHLILSLENRQMKGPVILGVARIPLTAIERRVDDRKVVSRWFSFDDSNDGENRAYKGRVHLRLCFDGGYHVMDESTHVCSDFRPTARQLWKPPVGTVELGIIGCKNLLPMKTANGKGSTDSYAVAKYGPKWVRTRTVCDSLDPRWNEQYTWKVYDPCTVLTIGVFDSWGVLDIDGSKEATRPDFRMGKVRIRISTLATGKVYKNTYPLLLLSSTGMKKMGEIEIGVRFLRATPTLDLLHVYSQPLLPLMHHIRPLGVVQQDALKNAAAKILAAHLSRSEPPLRREVVLNMLDADSQTFSMRKVRANWFRIINVIAGVLDVVRWVDNTRSWKNPTATILVHVLLVMLVWYPDLIVPTLAFYVFAIGAWNYRFRTRVPLPHLDPKISFVETVDRDELDEEFDTIPSSRPADVARARYDRLRMLGARVQTVLGNLATQGERVQALVTWRDPRATGIFIGLCFVVAIILYLVPSKMVAMAFGFYYLRHPMFRDRMPSPALNFFRRLPSLADRIM